MRCIFMLLMIGVLSLSACQHVPSYWDQCQAWVNRDAASLIREWGPPSQTRKMENGNTVYVWTTQAMDRSPEVAVRQPSTDRIYYSGGEVTIRTCETSFEATLQGIIVNVKVQGNGCP